jgi:hypothetical protein
LCFGFVLDVNNSRDNQERQGLNGQNLQRTGQIMENDGPKTISVPQAGKRYFDLAKNASYAAAARGEIPVIRIGGRLRVPVCQIERMLRDAKMPQLAK